MRQEETEAYLEVDPSLEGRVSWEGNTLVLRPASPLVPEQTYLVRLRAGAPSQRGRQVRRGVSCRFTVGRPRLVYLAADVDRCYGRRGLPDHGTLLANAVRWAARDRMPLRIEGPGYVDAHLYRQQDRLILHLINLSGCSAWPAYLEEHLPVGPLRVSVRVAPGWTPRRALLRVAESATDLHLADGWATVELPALVDHYVFGRKYLDPGGVRGQDLVPVTPAGHLAHVSDVGVESEVLGKVFVHPMDLGGILPILV